MILHVDKDCAEQPISNKTSTICSASRHKKNSPQYDCKVLFACL